MKKLLRFIAVAVLGVSLSTGLAAAQSGIDNGNGTNSDNTIRLDSDLRVDVDNRNNVRLDVDNRQDADSGDAEANRNTTVGDVGTGDATNDATVNASVDVSNGNGLCDCLFGNNLGGNDVDASIHNGNGTNSDNTITANNDVRINVDNRNDVRVDVDNHQDADSGDAEANANTTVGNVSTGAASNSFSSSTSISVSN